MQWICINCQELNNKTCKNSGSLPLVWELFDRLRTATMFSKIDLHDIYHQIEIKEGDEWKSAFRTCYRHFEHLVIPFGMANALATFQAFMKTTLDSFIDGCCIVYMVDILIYMEEPQQHMEHLQQILDQL